MIFRDLYYLPQEEGDILHELGVRDENPEVKVHRGGDPALEGEFSKLDGRDGLELQENGFHGDWMWGRRSLRWESLTT